MKQKPLIVMMLSILTSLPVSAMNYAHVTLTELQPSRQDALWSRTKQVTPAYPVEMAMKGIAGCGVFKISLDQEGKTESIDLLASVPKAAEKMAMAQYHWQAGRGRAKNFATGLLHGRQQRSRSGCTL